MDRQLGVEAEDLYKSHGLCGRDLKVLKSIGSNYREVMK